MGFLWIRLTAANSRVGSLFGKKEPEHTAVKATASGQADINIFTVASGLLYEVRGEKRGLSRRAVLTSYAALRLYHDPQCASQHEEQREVLVHREFPLTLVPRTYLCSHPTATRS